MLPERFATAVCLASLLTIAVYLIRHASKRRRPSPPGPKGYPLIGNMFDFPGPDVKPWIYWANYKKLYGPISSMTVFGTQMIIINDIDMAVSIMKRDTVADRPYQTFSSTLIGWENALAMMPYGDTHRLHRRYIHKTLGTREGAQKYESVIEKATHRFLYEVTQNPNALQKELRRRANSVILRIAYGYAVADKEDPLIKIAEMVTHDAMVSMVPGAFLVDSLPFLRHIPSWFPGAGFQRIGKQFRDRLREFVQLPHDFVKQQVPTGAARPSIVAELLDSLGSAEGSKEYLAEDFQIKWASAMIFVGSQDTTVSAAHSFYLAMLLNPHVQRRAQEEVDSVLGPGLGRLPTSADRAHMPYIDAVLKELWRRYSPFQLYPPRAATEDIEFEGYHFPKGSVIWANTWAINHNEDDFPNPMAFKPERFLQNSKKKPSFNPTDLVFGYGRRSCPGRELGELLTWFVVVMTLATVDISPERDSKGKEIIPPEEFTNFISSHPLEFKCRITPRSKQAAAFIHSAVDEPLDNDAETLHKVKWKYWDIDGKE